MANGFTQFMDTVNGKYKSKAGPGFSSFVPLTLNQGQSTPGGSLREDLRKRQAAGYETYKTNVNKDTTRLASDVVSKSAGQIPTDEFGIVQNQLTDFSSIFNSQIGATKRKGELAWLTDVAKKDWANAKAAQDARTAEQQRQLDLQSKWEGSWSGDGTDIPGADKNNPGAKAVSLAMQAYKNGVPYVWGGNSLSTGIDCSGLVQQVYARLGINVPRTTYEMARTGKRISGDQLRPGDLVFYNTGARDPNGRGVNSHVAIYMGNGKVIEAANSRSDMQISNLTGYNGPPSLFIRPY